jgi:peroxiredoxin
MRCITIKAIVIGTAALGAGALIAANPADADVEPIAQGKKAPAFSAPATDGKTHTLAGHLKEGMTFLYFIKEGCPVNHEAAPHVQKLAAAYKEKANLVGVFNGPVSGAKNWAKYYKSTFPIIEDPALKVIRAYGAAYSPWMIAVNKDGTIAKVFEGASPAELAEVNKLMAASSGQKLAALSFAGAPTGGG